MRQSQRVSSSDPPKIAYSFRQSNEFAQSRSQILRLWFKHQNGRFFVVVRRRSDVKAIELRRPEGSAGACPGRYFADKFVMICVFLLVHKNISNLIIAAAGNVHAFLRSIEIDAI